MISKEIREDEIDQRGTVLGPGGLRQFGLLHGRDHRSVADRVRHVRECQKQYGSGLLQLDGQHPDRRTQPDTGHHCRLQGQEKTLLPLLLDIGRTDHGGPRLHSALQRTVAGAHRVLCPVGDRLCREQHLLRRVLGGRHDRRPHGQGLYPRVRVWLHLQRHPLWHQPGFDLLYGDGQGHRLPGGLYHHGPVVGAPDAAHDPRRQTAVLYRARTPARVQQL